MPPDTTFDMEFSGTIEPGQTLLIGLTSPGLAGLTAANQLVDQRDGEEIGHISPADLPAITPFEDGEPRHHTRLYDIPDLDFTVLLSELFVPAWAARSFADQLVDWTGEVGIDEVVFLHGVPYPHGPEDHTAFFVATEGYRERRLDGTDIDAMSGGYLDGVAGELVSRSMSTDAPSVGIFVTPAHVPGPDVNGALTFLDAIEDVYDLSLDRTELEDLSDEIQKQLAALADRMATLEESEESQKEREFYADRMYM